MATLWCQQGLLQWRQHALQLWSLLRLLLLDGDELRRLRLLLRLDGDELRSLLLLELLLLLLVHLDQLWLLWCLWTKLGLRQSGELLLARLLEHLLLAWLLEK